MSDRQPTLATLFAGEDSGERFDGRAAIESSDTLDLLRQEVSARMTGVSWQAAKDGLLDQIGGLLDIGLGDVMAGAWNKSRKLLKYRDRDKYPPQESYVVELLDHTIKSKHKPYIELLLDGQPLQPRIEFDVAVSLRLKGFSLTVQDARIKAIHTGTLEAKGTIALGGAKLVERPLGKVKLPGKIPLGDGIAI